MSASSLSIWSIISVNDQSQYKDYQTFPIQPVQAPCSSSYQPQDQSQFSQIGSMLWREKNLLKTSQSRDILEPSPSSLLWGGSWRSLLSSTVKIFGSLLLDATYYTGPMGTGRITYTGVTPNQEWNYASPNSSGRAVLDFVCKQWENIMKNINIFRTKKFY